MHLLDQSPSECWKPLRLLGSVLTSKVWSIQEQNLGAQTGTYEEGHCRWCNIWDSVGTVGSVLRHRQCIQGLRAGSVAVHHLIDGTGGAVSVGKWGGRQLQKQSSSHTHTNPNKMCNLPTQPYSKTARGSHSQFYTAASILTHRSESCQKVTSNLLLG